jgi:hypothetical protein
MFNILRKASSMMDAKKAPNSDLMHLLAPKDAEPCLVGNHPTRRERKREERRQRTKTMSMAMFMVEAQKSLRDFEPCLDKYDSSESASVCSSCSTREGEPRTSTSLSGSYDSESSHSGSPQNVCNWSLPEGLTDEEFPMEVPISRPLLQGMKIHASLPHVISLGEWPGSVSSTCQGSCDTETETGQDSKKSDMPQVISLGEFSGSISSTCFTETGTDQGSKQSANAVIIFDWDDTLLPSKYCRNLVCPSLPSAEVSQSERLSNYSLPYSVLREHAIVVEKVLRAAASVARVKIVTLATEYWLKVSAEQLPGLNLPELLRELDVEVHHADRQAKDWVKAKQRSMAKCLRSPYGDYPNYPWNVISVGDSTIERDALQELFSDGRRYGVCKTLKLQESPTVSGLTEDLHVLTQILGDLVSCKHDLDLDILGLKN